MAKVLHSFSLNSYELRGYLNRCEGSQWMESFERKLVDLTCREILTTGEKGPNYILCISQRGKTYRWLTDFLFFFFSFPLQKICKFEEISTMKLWTFVKCCHWQVFLELYVQLHSTKDLYNYCIELRSDIIFQLGLSSKNHFSTKLRIKTMKKQPLPEYSVVSFV